MSAVPGFDHPNAPHPAALKSSGARVPPHNLAAERALLGAVLLRGKSALIVVSEIGLSADDFYHPAHKMILEAALKLEAADKPVDTITVASELRAKEQLRKIEGQESYLAGLLDDIPSFEHAGHYAKLVKEASSLRRLILACGEIASGAHNDPGDVAAFLIQSERRVAEIKDEATAEAPTARVGLIDQTEQFLARVRPQATRPVLHSAAFYGIAGDLVRAAMPYTEADPVAVLIQLLVATGNLMGRRCFARGGGIHRTNEFACLVGPSAKARKGTSWALVRAVLREIDPIWESKLIHSGFSSGEGLIYQVRDKRTEKEPIRDTQKRIIDYQDVVADHGADDKRGLWEQPEFASLLRVMARETNQLSGVIRNAFDGGRLETGTKNSPISATDTHVSIIAHITADELRAELTQTDAANGFGNRFLWLWIERSKKLPNGGWPPQETLRAYAKALADAAAFAKSADLELARDKAADLLWADAYNSFADPPGLVGKLTARVDAHALRLSMIYALLDRSPVIREDHVRAALAIVFYVEDSVRHTFGGATGDRMADRMMAIIRSAGEHGIKRDEIQDAFGRHASQSDIDNAGRILVEHGAACVKVLRTGARGRPPEVWLPTGGGHLGTPDAVRARLLGPDGPCDREQPGA